MTDVDDAWIAFKNKGEHIAKASVNEKLDVLAAQLNEVQTDTKRLAEIVPKIMGDENAIDEANASAMDPMAAMMGGGMPPMGGEDMGGEMPPEESMEGDEMPEGEEMPPEEGAMPEEGAEEMPPEIGGNDMDIPPEDEESSDINLDDELLGAEDEDVDMGVGNEDLFESGGEDDVIETLKDALQEALDNDQMGLVSKIADAIAKLQGSSASGEDILAGGEDVPMGDGDVGEDDDVSEESISVADILGDEGGAEPPAPEPEPEPESEKKEPETPDETPSDKDESVEKSAIAKDVPSAGAGGASPEGTMEPIEASGTEEVKAKVMEAVAEGLDEALGTDEEIPTDDESEDEEEYDEDDEEEYDEEGEEDEDNPEDKNEVIADNPFEECRTMKSALEFAEHTSFRDLLSIKKSRHFGIDGKPALDAFTKMDNTLNQLDELSPDVAMNVEDETVDDEDAEEEIPLEDVESAKDVTEAPDALEPGVRTEELSDGAEDVTDGVVSENDQLDEVGEPINAGGTTEGLDEPVDNTTVDGLSEDDKEDEELKEFGKSSTLDEVKCAKTLTNEGKSTDHGDLLDDVDEKKTPSGSAKPKPTLLDDIDEKKGKGASETSKSQLDDLDPHKGEGSAKKGGDLLDDVGHEKRATEHTVRPGTGLLDDVKEIKKSDVTDNGKHIMSMKEMMSVRKSGQRPDAVTSTSGDIVRPELGNPIRKTATGPSVRMGQGVDPKKVVENDWAEYNLYMAQKR